jgi:hypothetical protein
LEIHSGAYRMSSHSLMQDSGWRVVQQMDYTRSGKLLI